MPKRRYSAFFATDLALLLREQRIDTMVVAGVKTNVCIRATCQDAFAHGLRVVLPAGRDRLEPAPAGRGEPRGRAALPRRDADRAGGARVAVESPSLGYASADRSVAVDALPAPDATAVVRRRLGRPWPRLGGCAPPIAAAARPGRRRCRAA